MDRVLFLFYYTDDKECYNEEEEKNQTSTNNSKYNSAEAANSESVRAPRSISILPLSANFLSRNLLIRLSSQFLK